MKAPIRGSCHCGAVTFEVAVAPESAFTCNCSFCIRRGWRHTYVATDKFDLVSGEPVLRAYRFGESTDHCFCSVCGTHTHAYCTYTDPPHFSYSLACCETVDISALPVTELDGRAI